MKTIRITADIIECGKDELNADDRRLVQSAEDFLGHAYAPYSRFSVSAAALLDNGVIVNGTNQLTEGFTAGMGVDIKSLLLGGEIMEQLALHDVLKAKTSCYGKEHSQGGDHSQHRVVGQST